MSEDRLIRDPIHGFIKITSEECEIIDSSIFQRLRRIKQLAMAYHVYPGAVHTRFEHSLGVMDVAGRLCEKLKKYIDESHRILIRKAALLHDIGHGPFSHVSEYILKEISGSDNKGSKTEKIHERITNRIIETNKNLSNVLSEREREKICNLLATGYDDPIHKSIISGPLDADKQDYLLRDSYYCGVTYGVYDIDQLHNTLCCYEKNGEKHLAIVRDGVHSLEQYILAKYYLTTQVYRHKVRLITDNMLKRAIKLAVQKDKIKELIDLYTYKENNKYVNNYLDWDDNRVASLLIQPEHRKEISSRIFFRLINRELYKRVFSESIDFLENIITKSDFQELYDKIKEDIESEIAEFLNSKLCNCRISKEEVILNYFNIKSVRVQSRDSEDTEAAILVNTGDKPSYFEDESVLFKSIDERGQEEWIECYAPVTFKDKSERKRINKQMKEKTKIIIEKHIKKQGGIK